MKWTANGSHLWLITLTTKENGNPDKLITQITKVIFYFIYISFPICCAKILPYCWWLSMITTLFELLFHLEPDSCKINFIDCSPCPWLSFNDNSFASIHLIIAWNFVIIIYLYSFPILFWYLEKCMKKKILNYNYHIF